VSFFEVRCGELKKVMLKKYEAYLRLLQGLMAKRAKTEINTIHLSF